MALDDMGVSLDQAHSLDNATSSSHDSASNATSKSHGNTTVAPVSAIPPAEGPTTNAVNTSNTPATSINMITDLPVTANNPSSTTTTVTPVVVAGSASVNELTQPTSPARSLPPTPAPSAPVSRAVLPSGPRPVNADLPPPIQLPTRCAASLGSVETPRSATYDNSSTSNNALTTPSTVEPSPRAKKRNAVPSASAPISKRAHVASSPDRLRELNPWFAKAICMVEDSRLGNGWLSLVAAWIHFKEILKCELNGTLSAKGRPVAIADWIQRARNPNWRPPMVDSKAYGDKHLAWWTSLQPEWRVLDGEAGLACSEDGNLQSLKRPGANSLLSVIASLYFWGDKVRAAGKKSKRWDNAVDNMLYVLTSLSG